MTPRRVAPLALLALLLAPGAPLAAQALKHYTASRQFHGEVHLVATVEFAGGTLHVGAGDPGELYALRLAYDPTRAQPVNRWDAAQAAVTLGLTGRDAGAMGVGGSGAAQTAEVTFSPQADLDLTLQTGASESRADFGGLRLASLVVETGASRTEVDFSRPNAMRCREAAFRAGAAQLTVQRLGDARCDRVSFEGGAGSAALDYSGAWSGTTTLSAKLAVGGLTLRIPRSVGVTLTTERFLSTFEPAGFTRQGNRYTSTNRGTATRFLDVTLNASLGGVTIEWVD